MPAEKTTKSAKTAKATKTARTARTARTAKTARTTKATRTKQTSLIHNKNLSLCPFAGEVKVIEPPQNPHRDPIYELFETRYFPRNVGEFVGNRDVVSAFGDLLADPSDRKLIILYGPHGVGKTTLCRLMLDERYNIVEYNVDNTSDKSNLFVNIIRGLNTTNVIDGFLGNSKPRIILIEDIDKCIGDGVYYNKLLDSLESKTGNTKIVATTSTLKKKYKSVTKIHLLEFATPGVSELCGYARGIALKEKLDIPDEGIKKMVLSSGMDIRKLLHTIKLLTFNTKLGERVELEDISRVINFSEPDANFSAYEIVEKSFSGSRVDLSSTGDKTDRMISYCSGEQNTIMDLFYSNIGVGKLTIGEISKIEDSLCMGDIFHKAMFMDQNWDLKNYSVIFGCLDPMWVINNRRNKDSKVQKLRVNYLNNFALYRSKTKSVYDNAKINRQFVSTMDPLDLCYSVNHIIKPKLESSDTPDSDRIDGIKLLNTMGVLSQSYYKLRTMDMSKGKVPSLSKKDKSKLEKLFDTCETTTTKSIITKLK